MRTKAWLSFFHRMRFFPEREKQNERDLGNVETGLSPDVTDLVDGDGFCVLGAGNELMNCLKSPRLARLKEVDMLPVRIEGSIWAGTTSGSSGLCGRKGHGAAPREAMVDVAAICRVLVMTWWHWGQKIGSIMERPG
jgi:hypothetical protein